VSLISTAAESHFAVEFDASVRFMHLLRVEEQERSMPMQLVPEEFAEIAKLSDEERAESKQAVTAVSNPELAEQVRAHYLRERLGGTPRQALSSQLQALSDESFKQLMGWVLFGRDYAPSKGDPSIVLEQYIRDATIYPRNYQESYLEQKPIGKYLRRAMEHILTTTSRDIERAQKAEYEIDEEEVEEKFG
jgi:hypothetical protein